MPIEQAEPRVAVSFLHVAEHLIVRAVLPDDIDAMLDRAGFADFRRNRIVGLAGLGGR